MTEIHKLGGKGGRRRGGGHEEENEQIVTNILSIVPAVWFLCTVWVYAAQEQSSVPFDYFASVDFTNELNSTDTSEHSGP
jgi:hypothetical protein